MCNSECIEVRIPMPWGFIAGCWYGDRRLRPILALHGWQNNAGSFARLAPLLTAHDISILAVDFPGHGRSTHYPIGVQYHLLDHVRLIGHIMRYYKWQEVSLMAHSLAASVSFLFAALFPDRVDMVIALDLVKTREFPASVQLTVFEYATENQLAEDDRLLQRSALEQEPRRFTFAKLEKMLHAGSEYSIDVANAKHILARCVKPSALEADQFYFAHDRRIKHLIEYNTEPALVLEMAKRIRNVNYLVIKGGKSYHLNEESDAVLALLRENNPNFEFHQLANGTHHVHLNNADEVATKIVNFLRKCNQLERLQFMEKAKL